MADLDRDCDGSSVYEMESASTIGPGSGAEAMKANENTEGQVAGKLHNNKSRDNLPDALLSERLQRYQKWCSFFKKTKAYWGLIDFVTTRSILNVENIPKGAQKAKFKSEAMRCTICEPKRTKYNVNKQGLFCGDSAVRSIGRHMDSHAKEVMEIEAALEEQNDTIKRAKTKSESNVASSSKVKLSSSSIYKFLSVNGEKSTAVKQSDFNEDVVLFFCKAKAPLSQYENAWFRRMLLRQNHELQFVSRRLFTEKHIPRKADLVRKALQEHVDESLCGSLSFDLWMSRSTEEVFSLCYHFVDNKWEMQHKFLCLFKCEDTDDSSIADQLCPVLETFHIKEKIIGVVKDEGSNLKTMMSALLGEVSSVCFPEPFDCNCYAHAVSKAASEAFKIDFPLLDKIIPKMQKLVTWTKKSSDGASMLANAQAKGNLPVRKLISRVTTRFAVNIAWFAELLKNRPGLELLYEDLVLLQDTRRARLLAERLPPQSYWIVVEVVYNCTKSILESSVLQQTRGYWLLSDALLNLARLYLKLRNMSPDVKAVIDKISLQKPNDIPEAELNRFISDMRTLDLMMRMAIRITLLQFLRPLYSFQREKSHVFLSLRLDSRYKSLKALLVPLQYADEYERKERKALDRELFKLTKKQAEMKQRRAAATKSKGRGRKRKYQQSVDNANDEENSESEEIGNDATNAQENSRSGGDEVGTQERRAGEPLEEEVIREYTVKDQVQRLKEIMKDYNGVLELMMLRMAEDEARKKKEEEERKKNREEEKSGKDAVKNGVSEEIMDAGEDILEDIFEEQEEAEMETTEVLRVKRQLQAFTRFCGDTKLFPLHWYKKNADIFPLVAKVARAIFSIAGSEIENERVFSFTGLLSSLRRNRTSVKLLDHMLMVDYNYSKDPTHGILNHEKNVDQQTEYEEKFTGELSDFLAKECETVDLECKKIIMENVDEEGLERLKELTGLSEDDLYEH
eukprot:Nk52_evm66s153 gene=Nk52_evmTU66s153